MILISYGTRPEWIKIKPLIEEFKKENIPFKILFTGQHTHLANFHFDYALKVENSDNRLNEIIASVLSAPSDMFEGVKYALVQGDTASTYAVGLSAFNHGVGVIHLEAGLRTYDLDNPYPEEGYRQMLSRIADIHLCATANNRDSLEVEKVLGDKYVVGNTVLDNIRHIECNYGDTVLVTMHRRENLDIMDQWFSELNQIAKDNKNLHFVIPMHPNPAIQIHKKLLTEFDILNPLSHEEMISLIAKSRFIISDSGGMQEEASFLNKKVIVCRKFTERTESLGGHSILCRTPQDLKETFYSISDRYEIDEECPYGDGYASHKICQVLKGKLND